MSAYNMLQGLKLVGDIVSGVAGAGAAIAGMSVDDNAAFANTDASCSSTGGTPANFLGRAFDATPTGGSPVTPYVVSHVMTLGTGDFNGATVKRLGLHNASSPTAAGTTLMFGVDGLAIGKTSAFSLRFTATLSYE